MLLAAAARGIAVDGACCCKSVHRVEPLIPKAPGAPVGAMADMARGQRAAGRADHVSRSAVLTRAEPVTWSRHLRLPGVNPDLPGQRVRRHYWLAPRSDDAVGAAVIRSRVLAMSPQLDIGCHRFGLAGRARPLSRPSGAAGMPVGTVRRGVVPEV